MSGEAANHRACDVTVVIISFNTRDLLRESILSVERESEGLNVETLVIDNGSRDGSQEMVRSEFPHIRLNESEVNLGFGVANNVGFELAQGRYIVLLNSDAFLCPDSLRIAVRHMDENPNVGLGGGRLVGRDGSWQPSARTFPSLLTDFTTLSGLTDRYPKSRLFGKPDRTWADPDESARVDWVPGAFSIIRADVLREVGYFDPAFFLYYEEVDLCRRLRNAGHDTWYWSDIRVIHIGGESAKTVQHVAMSSAGAQLALWRMRSELLYYRKHHGSKAFFAMLLEVGWNGLRVLKNRLTARGEAASAKAESSLAAVRLMRQAWRDTRGGRLSPDAPW